MNFTNISKFNQTPKSEVAMFSLGLYMSDAEGNGLVGFVVVFGSVGFLENGLLILSIILTDEFFETPGNVLVLSLACADLLVCCVCAPLFICYLSYSIRTIFITLTTFSAVATTGNIFLLTMNRFVSLVRPLKYRKIMTFRRTVFAVGAVWLVAGLTLATTAIGFNRELKAFFQIPRIVIVLCVTLSTVMYVYMYILGRKHRKYIAQLNYAVTGELQAASDEFRALRSLLMVSGSAVVCWLPVTIVSFVTDQSTDPAGFCRAFGFTAPLVIVNAVIDPAVYYFHSRDFRVLLKKLFRRFRNVIL